jgi:hypothetical protein
MISECANPDCRAAFDYHNGRYFRFHKIQHAGEQRPNTHCVQHFWLCQSCSTEYTLNYHADRGVFLLRQPDISAKCETCCFVAAA